MRNLVAAAAVLAALAFAPHAAAAVQPGQSWDAAVRAAACGETVQLAAGNHGDQTITATRSCPVTLAGDRSVVARSVKFAGATNIAVRGITVTYDVSVELGNNITISDVDGPGFYLGKTGNVTMNGNDWGPCDSSGPARCASQTIVDNPTGAVVIDGDRFHDFKITADGDHYECMYVSGTGSGSLTIRNSRFDNCETYAVYLTGFAADHSYGGPALLENNWFGRTCCFGSQDRNSAVNLGGSGVRVSNVTLRGNTFAQGQTLVREGGQAGTNNVATGNTFGAPGCVADVAYSNNRIVGGVCGPGDVRVDSVTAPPPPAPEPTVVDRIRGLLRQQIQGWRAQGWSWTKVKATAVWSAYVLAGGR